MKNVIIYTRVSTDEQRKSGYSLQYQEESLIKYCQIKKYNIIKHYQDDYTGTTFDRPEYNELLLFCKANKTNIDLILVIKWDRFARNAPDAFQMIKKLNNWGIEINSSEQPLDLTQPESKLMLSNYLVMSEIESDRTSMRTKDALHQAAKNGRYTGRAPYGFDNTKDEEKKSMLVRNNESKNVIESFRLMAKGIYTYEEVRQIMSTKGFKKHKTPFKNMLTNVAYIGKVLVKEYKKEPMQIVNGVHEGFIDEDIFYRVQEILQGNNKKISKTNKRNPELPLRGYLICDKCGGNLTGERAKGNGGYYHYYRCQNGCKERFSAKIAHTEFNSFLQNITIPEEVAILYKEIVKDVFKEKEGDRDVEINKLKKDIDEVNANILKLDEKFHIQEKIEINTYERLSSHYTKQLLDLKNRINILQDTDSNITKYFDFGISLFTNPSIAYEASPIEIKQKFIGSIFPNKLTFSENKYRTNVDDNSILDLIFKIKELESIDNKKAAKNSGLYYKAPLPGLEPGTP